MTEQDYGGTDDPIDDRSDDGSLPALPEPAEMQAAILNARRADLTQMMNELPADHPGRKVIAEALAVANAAEDAATIEWVYGSMRAWAQEWIQTNILDAISPEVPAATRLKLQAQATALQNQANSYQQVYQHMCGVLDGQLRQDSAAESYFKNLDPFEIKIRYASYAEYLAARNLASEQAQADRKLLKEALLKCTVAAQARWDSQVKAQMDAEFKAHMAKQESLKLHNVIKAKVKDFFYRAVNFVKKALNSGGTSDTTNDGLTPPPPPPAAPPPPPSSGGTVTSGPVYSYDDQGRLWVQDCPACEPRLVEPQPSTRR